MTKKSLLYLLVTITLLIGFGLSGSFTQAADKTYTISALTAWPSLAMWLPGFVQ